MTTPPILFAIKHYALHDGPNIRTTVFFKGCPLNCFWCHNPEGIGSGIELISDNRECIGCRECIHGCPTEALAFRAGTLVRDEEKCTLCLNCLEICPTLAHEAAGYHSSLESIMAEIEKDIPFFDQSGGGVTFSGGEPLQQPLALLELLQRCGRLEIHRAVDTTGFAPTPVLLEVARHTDLFLYDLKHLDSNLHKQHTGVPNELILHNLDRLAASHQAVRIRIPLLHGINDDPGHIKAIGSWLQGLRAIEGIDVLPYHSYASTKYGKLNRSYGGTREHVPDRQTIQRVKTVLEDFGHTVRVGG